MRIRKVFVICFLSVLFFSLNTSECIYAAEDTQKLESFDNNLEQYPEIKVLNEQGNIKMLNKEVKFSKYESIVFDAVLMDKYTTMLFCTVKNNRVDKSNTENYITNMQTNNLKGIENEKYTGLTEYARYNLSDGTQKYSVLYFGKPSYGNKLNITVSTKNYGTKNIDILLDDVNIINSDFEKNLNAEIKIEDNNLKIDRIYCSPLATVLFIETDKRDSITVKNLFNSASFFNKPEDITAGVYYDDKKISSFAQYNKTINNVNKYWVMLDAISYDTKKISLNYKDKKIPLVDSVEINELKSKEKNSEENVSSTVVNTDKYTIKHDIKENIDPKKFNLNEKIGVKDSGDELKVGLTNGSSNLISRYKRVNSGESIHIEYKVVCTKGNISMRFLDSNKNVISTIEENQTGTISIQFKENDICYLDVKTSEDTAYYLDFSWKKSK